MEPHNVKSMKAILQVRESILEERRDGVETMLRLAIYILSVKASWLLATGSHRIVQRLRQ